MSTPEEAAREIVAKIENDLSCNHAYLQIQIAASLRSARTDALEEAAKIAENANLDHKWAGDECAGIAAAIRARKDGRA